MTPLQLKDQNLGLLGQPTPAVMGSPAPIDQPGQALDPIADRLAGRIDQKKNRIRTCRARPRANLSHLSPA